MTWDRRDAARPATKPGDLVRKNPLTRGVLATHPEHTRLIPLSAADGTTAVVRGSSAVTMATLPVPLSSALPEEQTDPFVGSRYRLLSRLSSTGTGVLCVVEHRALGKQFLAKLLHPYLLGDEQAVDRMRLEAQALGRLRHPNVVGIVGFEYTSAGIPYLITELVRGHSLAEELANRGAIPVEEALEWVEQLLCALEAAHAVGLVHREIHPGNLLLHASSEGARILKVVNFGAARVIANAPESAPRPLAVPTTEGALVGAPCCASPEALRGQTVDARSDLFQVGSVLYWMITGRPAAQHQDPETSVDTPNSAIRGRLQARVLPSALEPLLRRALAEDPDARFQTAAEFRTALASAGSTATCYLDGLSAAFDSDETAPASERVPSWDLASPSPDRLRQLLLLVALFLVSAGMTIVIGLLVWRRW